MGFNCFTTSAAIQFVHLGVGGIVPGDPGRILNSMTTGKPVNDNRTGHAQAARPRGTRS